MTDPFLASGAGGGLVFSPDSGGGAQIVDYRPPLIHARITGVPSGYDYPWQQVNDMTAGLENYTAPNFALSGTSTSIPFREINFNTRVPIGAVVRGMMNQSQDAYLFAYGTPGSPSADCSSFALLPECATLTVTEVLGACACVPTGQTASLTQNSVGALTSDDLLYGCQPGVITEDCPAGAPDKFNLIVAGFTGGSTGYNGNWTLTYDEVDGRWEVTRSGVTWLLQFSTGGGGSWILSGNDGSSSPSYAVSGVPSCCTSVTLDLDDGGSSEDPPATLTVTPATACGNGPSYTPYLERIDGDCGPCLRLRWIPSAGSGARSITWERVGCGEDSDGSPYIEFATADPLLCTGDIEECGENKVVVRVTCDECSCQTCDEEDSVEWTAAGWYTISGGCCRYFATADDVPEGATLCGGPYETQSACEDYVYLECCPTDGIPRSICINLESADCGITDGGEYSRILVEYNGSGTWEGGYVYGDGVYFGGPGYMYDVSLTFTCGDPLSGLLTWQIIWERNSSPSNTCGFGVTSGSIACDSVIGSSADGTFPGNGGGTCVTYICAVGNEFTATLESGLDGCDVTPTPTTYNCVDATCTPVYDGSGEFSTLAECEVDCEGDAPSNACCDIQDGASATLNIPDGTYAGSYSGSWIEDVGTQQLIASFVVIGLGSVEVACDLLTGSVFAQVPGDSVVASDIDCGPPLATFTFPGAIFGATGDVTVSTAV